MKPLADFLQARTRRERALLAVLATAVAALVWFLAVVDPLARRAEAVEQELAAERLLLEQVDATRARNAVLPPPRPPSDTSLLLLVSRALQQAGLSSYLEESNADGARRVRLSLKDAPFPAVSAWLADLAAREGVRTASANIERGASPGLAHISLVLERGN